jgi:hypothetical protein
MEKKTESNFRSMIASPAVEDRRGQGSGKMPEYSDCRQRPPGQYGSAFQPQTATRHERPSMAGNRSNCDQLPFIERTGWQHNLAQSCSSLRRLPQETKSKLDHRAHRKTAQNRKQLGWS